VLATSRILRSLYWLGLLAVDDPDAPQQSRLTALGSRILRMNDETPLVPEEPHFFLQPNAEAFAPPNLSPRTLFHLRRITGEKKGGPAGMYPVTTESLRRAFDSGVAPAEVSVFLERFSRTGLPPNVRALVETAGRQHGRIRLVPAEYVLVTDEPGLLDELRNVKQVEPLLGDDLTERAVRLEAQDAGELLKRLRARGYAPLDLSVTGDVPPLAEDPESVSPLPEMPVQAARRTPGELDWTHIADGEEPDRDADLATGPEEIRALLDQAQAEQFAVEIEYRGKGPDSPTVRTICPAYLAGDIVVAHCRLREAERYFNISRIAWARATEEGFDL
jgi:hypothetical protein